MPETDPTATAAMQFVPTPDSSQIHSYAYVPDQNLLVLRFNSNAHRVAYGYPNVAPEKFAEFQAAESKGSWFYANLKSQYPRGSFIYLNADGSPQASPQA